MSPRVASRLEIRVLCSLRRIIRAVDIYSRRLNSQVGLTSPQLICLQSVVRGKRLTLSMVTKDVSLSGSTITGIVDRLEAKGLLVRERSRTDRRKVYLKPTPAGVEVVKASPSLLQDTFANALRKLAEDEQINIAESLERIVALMEAEDIEASPNLIPPTATDV
ncbi:MAG: MarR family winged helix-turn-helix transcriptional regulator [Lentisphaeria bacterium]|nr:MarR family winged helix-turn-helix transcriptional regulator [Lentisphaeria bacterium]